VPPPDTCTVWWADLASAGPGVADLLSEAELARRSRLARSDDRDRFTIGAALLRSAVAVITGLLPADVVIDRRCRHCGREHGRPTAPGTGLFLSVSHSHERIAVAVTPVAEVGVDVEWIDPEWTPARTADLGSLVLAADETVADAGGFFTYWTRKEAAIKATGDGMQVPMADVRVTAPDEPASLLSYPGRPDLAMQLIDLDAGAGYAAALAVLGDVLPAVEHRPAGELGVGELRVGELGVDDLGVASPG
jgi:4'-phosphopantetheinyl transferase